MHRKRFTVQTIGEDSQFFKFLIATRENITIVKKLVKNLTILLRRGCKMTAMVDLYQTQSGFKSLSQTVFKVYAKNRFSDPYADTWC